MNLSFYCLTHLLNTLRPGVIICSYTKSCINKHTLMHLKLAKYALKIKIYTVKLRNKDLYALEILINILHARKKSKEILK